MAGLTRCIAALTLLACGVSAVEQKPIGSSSKPLVDTEKLQAAIEEANLVDRAKKLYKIAQLSEHEFNHPTRVIGSAGHLGTLDYVQAELAKLGDYYKVSNQSFDAVQGSVSEFRLVINNTIPTTAAALALTPATKDKEPVYGNLVLVDNEGCDASDIPAAVKGNIALIKRGTCAFGTKSENVGKAGALAAVVYNTDNTELHGTLGDPSPNHVATVSISLGEAAPLVKALQNGETLSASVYVDANIERITTYNIIAQTVDGDQDNIVMLGGHSDSVAEGPGINDDGSGSLTVLEVAKQLTKFRVNNAVRFGWFSGEEEGLLGSNHYAGSLSPEENMKVRLFMDYDMMGSPNYAYQVYNGTDDDGPAGSQALRDLYADWYSSHGYANTFIPFDGRSDYFGFIYHGIPAGGIATGAEQMKTSEEVKMFGGKAGEPYDWCYHQLCDDVSNVDLTAWVANTKLVAHSVATYAKSLEDFPKRTEATAKSSTEGFKYRGSKLYL